MKELTVNMYFNMIMKAGIAHYFYYCEDKKIA